MVDLRVFGMKRGTIRKPGGLSDIDLVIWSSSCSATTNEKSLTCIGRSTEPIADTWGSKEMEELVNVASRNGQGYRGTKKVRKHEWYI